MEDTNTLRRFKNILENQAIPQKYRLAALEKLKAQHRFAIRAFAPNPHTELERGVSLGQDREQTTCLLLCNSMLRGGEPVHICVPL